MDICIELQPVTLVATFLACLDLNKKAFSIMHGAMMKKSSVYQRSKQG